MNDPAAIHGVASGFFCRSGVRGIKFLSAVGGLKNCRHRLGGCVKQTVYDLEEF